MLATPLRERVENVLQITAKQLLEAYALADQCRPVLDGMFGPRLDVILTPSSKGEAPEGLHTTGDAVFNKMWTLDACVRTLASRFVSARPDCRSASPGWPANGRSASAGDRSCLRPGDRYRTGST